MQKKISLFSVGALAVAGMLGVSPQAAHAETKCLDTYESDVMVRFEGDSQVYLYNHLGFREYRPFFSEKARKTWSSNIVDQPAECAAQIKLATKNPLMSYRPGTTLVKLSNSPLVYVVGKRHTLYPIQNEKAAARLFGAYWTEKIELLNASEFSAFSIRKERLQVGELYPGALAYNTDTGGYYEYDLDTFWPLDQSEITPSIVSEALPLTENQIFDPSTIGEVNKSLEEQKKELEIKLEEENRPPTAAEMRQQWLNTPIEQTLYNSLPASNKEKSKEITKELIRVLNANSGKFSVVGEAEASQGLGGFRFQADLLVDHLDPENEKSSIDFELMMSLDGNEFKVSVSYVVVKGKEFIRFNSFPLDLVSKVIGEETPMPNAEKIIGYWYEIPSGSKLKELSRGLVPTQSTTKSVSAKTEQQKFAEELLAKYPPLVVTEVSQKATFVNDTKVFVHKARLNVEALKEIERQTVNANSSNNTLSTFKELQKGEVQEVLISVDANTGHLVQISWRASDPYGVITMDVSAVGYSLRIEEPSQNDRRPYAEFEAAMEEIFGAVFALIFLSSGGF